MPSSVVMTGIGVISSIGFLSHIAAELGLEGPNITIPAACVVGNQVVAFAYDTIHCDSASVMFAGGSDCFSRITYTAYAFGRNNASVLFRKCEVRN